MATDSMKICVAIPTFNRERLLKEAVDSLLKNLPGFDVYIFDNASTDGTECAMREYRSTNVVYQKNPTNLGYVGNLNLCLSLATKYDWVGILHSDDLSCVSAESELRSLLENEGAAGIVYGAISEISSEGVVVRNAELKYCRWTAGPEAIGRAQTQIPCSAMFYSSRAVKACGLYNSAFRFCADEEYSARIACAFDIVEIPVHVASYRRHSGHTMVASWRNDEFVDEFVAMRLKMNAYLPEENRVPDKEIVRKAALTLFNHCSGLIAHKEYRIARRFYLNLFRLCPLAFLEPHILARALVHWTPYFGPIICRRFSKNAG